MERKDYFNLPCNRSFPDRLVFYAQDGEGNPREVVYYRADSMVEFYFHGKVEDVFNLHLEKRDFDEGKELEK